MCNWATSNAKSCTTTGRGLVTSVALVVTGFAVVLLPGCLAVELPGEVDWHPAPMSSAAAPSMPSTGRNSPAGALDSLFRVFGVDGEGLAGSSVVRAARRRSITM